jgi:hypothetical protein
MAGAIRCCTSGSKLQMRETQGSNLTVAAVASDAAHQSTSSSRAGPVEADA